VLAAIENVTIRLTLLIPDLAGRQRPSKDPLSTLIRRADRAPAAHGLYLELARLFDLHLDADLPVAALTLLGDTGERRPGYWLRADPVYIEATHDRLIMAGSAGLDLGLEEAIALCDEVNERLRPEGLQLIVGAPTRWYCSWPEVPSVPLRPLPDLIGKDLYEYMPAGGEGRPWRQLLNYVQMILHSSRINEGRRAKGLAVINGLWFWGGGALPPVMPSPFLKVWSEDPLVRGLAMNAGMEPLGVPVNAEEWLSRATPGAHLLTLDKFPLDAFERWLAPLRAALRDGRIERLILCATDGSEYHVTRRSLRRGWRWWR
jgi:hypothetical protein